MSDTFEIEIKSLLGNKENAERLRKNMKAKDPNLILRGSHKQLNHYFVGGDLKLLAKNLKSLLKDEDYKKLVELSQRAKNFSLRTRLADQKLLLVLKVSVDDTTSENGTARLEFEADVPNCSLEELDEHVLESSFKYQAKWSREREEYFFLGTNVSIDKNAGYGYLAEFEMLVEDKADADKTKEKLRAFMEELGVVELEQARLARMFDFYNTHWQDYYGTEKTFVIE